MYPTSNLKVSDVKISLSKTGGHNEDKNNIKFCFGFIGFYGRYEPLHKIQ